MTQRRGPWRTTAQALGAAGLLLSSLLAGGAGPANAAQAAQTTQATPTTQAKPSAPFTKKTFTPNPPCPPTAPQLDAARLQALASQSRDRGLLWRIDYQGKSSWLYGTVHVGQPEWLFPGPRIASALQASDSLMLELDVTDPDTVNTLQQGMLAQPQAPVLPAPLAQRLQKSMAAACAQHQLQPLRTEAQVITLQMLAGRSHGLFAEFGADAALAALAKRWNKPIHALESAQDQLQLLTVDDPAELAESVDSALTQLENDSATQTLVTAARAWEQGDSATLENYAQWCHCVNTALDRKALRALLDERNPGMADGIATQLRAGHSVLAAVGALHLVGAQGVPALLRQQGFEVQAVPLNADGKQLKPNQAVEP